ncbi:MAG: SPFH domain-containing protein [Bacillaceae bacterium]
MEFGKPEPKIVKSAEEIAAMKKRYRKIRIITTTVGVVAIGLFTFFAGRTVVPAGQTGIVYKANGGVVDKTLSQGWKWTVPFVTKVNLYTTSTEQSALSQRASEGGEANENFTIMTADGKGIDVDLEFSYHYDAERLPEVFTRFKGKDGEVIEQQFIKPKLKAVANNVSTQFKVLDVYSEGRPELNTAILKAAKEFFDEYGIIIESAQITQMRLDEKTEETIQAVVDKQQELEKVKLDKEIAAEQAEKAKITAKGEAEAALIKAEGERKANEAVSKSLNAELLKKMEMEARLKHGWVEVQTGEAIVDTTKKNNGN